MSSIAIHDLPLNQEVDAAAMSAVRGGSLASLGNTPFANVNVNVDIDQTIQQFQQVNVNALNNIGTIGANLGLDLDVKAIQGASAGITL